MHRRRLLVCLAVLLCWLSLAGMALVSDENLLYNLDFFLDTNGYVDAWELSDQGAFSTRDDAQQGKVVVLQGTGSGTFTMKQDVMVQGGTNYGMRLSARVVSGDATARLEIEGYEQAHSDSLTKAEWTSVAYYGQTHPDAQSVPLVFSVTSSSDQPWVVEIAQPECFLAHEIPSGAKFEYLYDRGEYEAEQKALAQDKPSIQGFWICTIVLAAFAALLWWASKTKAALFEHKHAIRWLIGGGLVLGILLSFPYPGHPTDINNFSAWASQLAKVGIPNFYTSGMWADYPPGYMVVLYVCGMLGRLLGVAHGHPLFTLIIKLPALLADAGCAYFLYRMAKKKGLSERACLLLAALFAFNPMTYFDSAIWGQMDSVLTLMLLAALWFYLEDRKPWCAALVVLGVLVKPQMLVFGPLLLVAYVIDIVRNPKKGLKDLGLSVLLAVVIVAAFSLVFGKGQSPTWLLALYTSAANLYRFATVNAFNLYAFFGMNWAPDTTPMFFGLSAATMGTVFIVAVCGVAGLLYVKRKDVRSLIPLCGLVMWGVFALSMNMHERYLYPAILLFLWAYIDSADKRYLLLFALSSVVTFYNSALVLANASALLMGAPWQIVVVSALNLVGMGYAFWVCATPKRKLATLTLWRGDGAKPLTAPQEGEPTLEQRMDGAKDRPFTLTTNRCEKQRMVRRDYLLMALITVAYAIIAMINLGSTAVPQSFWRPTATNEQVMVEFGQEVSIAQCYYYPGVGLGRIDLAALGQNGEVLKTAHAEIGGFDMYSWKRLSFEGTTNKVTVTALDAKVLINEMSFLDSTGAIIPIASVTNASEGATAQGVALFDEQNLVDLQPDFMTQMYFDEVYHARTAFEHLHGYAPYENTHPPLGKVFIMAGISLFGMNPFGWRIVGTVFGILMLPLLYVFAKRLFKSTRVATIATFLFAVDGMHFAQTRIATIDVYGVFFIIAMCYFMFRYWQMNFFVDKLSATFKPLGLCGLMFGLGCASKWIGFYAGAGLAVALFTTLGKRYLEYRHAKRRLGETEDGEERALCEHVTPVFWKHAVGTCLFCLVFFIVIPAGIYLASYLPYLLCAEKPYTLKQVWDVQTYMFSYHSGLTATHPFASPWYEWPLVVRPIYYFMGTGLPEGQMQSIASFGNPIVWWAGFIATTGVAYRLLRRRVAGQVRSTVVYLFICLGAAFLPWVFITRCTFIYHYFASVPFIILLLSSRMTGDRERGLPPWAWALCGVALVVFIWFYPVWSGLVINRSFALHTMRWLPTWWFFS